MTLDTTKKIVRLNLGLAFVEGLFVLWQYIQTPSETGSAVLFGFSLLRLTILAGIILLLASVGYLFVSSWRALWWEGLTGKSAALLLNSTQTFVFLTTLIGLLYFFLFASDHYLGSMAGYRGRLLPLLIWLTAVVVQLLLSWSYIRIFDLHFTENVRSLMIPAGTALLSIVAIAAFVKLTRIGRTPDDVYWQEAGVPIMFGQVLLIALLGALLYFLFMKVHVPDNKKVDALIFICLWAITFVVWNAHYARPSFNALAPVAPNFQSYPFGDAMRYDVTAQSFLIGKPIPADFWTKPLYSLFLALLHLVAGQNLGLLVSLQVACLAITPAFAYGLTRLLGGRQAGVVAALLVILRERNSIVLSNVLQVSHVKLLLSDVFSMAGLILLTWLIVSWLQSPSLHRARPVAIGGVMGLLILTRGHPIVIAPFLYVIVMFFLRSDVRLLRESLWRLTVGLSVVMVPWFWHTYELTGRFAFQDSSSPFATRDAFVKAVAEPSSEQPPSYGQFETQIIQQVLQHPMDVADFVSAHYFHNLTFSYIYLPQSFQVESLRAYAKRMPFWGDWDGSLSGESWLLFLVNAFILSLGLGAAWKRTHGLVFVPLLISASYNLSVAISRRSGWRFMLPAEWVVLVFYGIGILQLILIVHGVVKRSFSEQMDSDTQQQSPSSLKDGGRFPYIMSVGLFLIVAAIVWGHRLIPLSYPAIGSDELLRRYEEILPSDSELYSPAIETFMKQDNAVILYGRALYPVYNSAKDGTFSLSWPAFSRMPYNRVVFQLIGPESMGVIFPTETWPAKFPDGSDVIVVGCKTESGVIQALSVVLTRDAPILYQSDPLPPLVCPLSEPQ